MTRLEAAAVSLRTTDSDDEGGDRATVDAAGGRGWRTVTVTVTGIARASG